MCRAICRPMAPRPIIPARVGASFRSATGPTRVSGNLRGQLWQLRQLGLVSLLHPRPKAMPGQRLREHGADLGALVGIVDLVAAEALANPGLRHALSIPDRDDLVLESEIAG